mgnify:CR=1 FL=1
MRFNDETPVASDDLNDYDIKGIARVTARQAIATAKDEHAADTRLSDLPMVDISDYCRDAAWDVLADEELDFDEWGMTITEVAEGFFMEMA